MAGGFANICRDRRQVVWLAGYVLGYLALQEVAFALLPKLQWIPLLWPPAGIATLALLLTSRSRWPTLLVLTFLASAAGNVFHGQAWLGSALYAGYNVLVPLAGAFSYRLLGSHGNRLDDLKDLRNLIIGPCLVAPMLSSFVGILVLHLAGVVHPPNYLLEWEHHWVGQALGVLAILPVGMTWPRDGWESWEPRRVLGATAWLLVILVGAWWTFRFESPIIGAGPILDLAPFMLLYWVAVRYGPFAGAVGAALATGWVVFHFLLFEPMTPFGTDVLELVRSIRAFLVAIILPTLGLAVTMQERTTVQARLAEARRKEIAQLRQLDTMRRDFVNRASHEFRTPLTPLGLQVEVLADGGYGPMNETQTKAMNIVCRNVQRLTLLAEDLMTAGLLQSDRLGLKYAPVDIRTVAEDAHANHAAQAAARGIHSELDLDAADLLVDGDMARIQQVASNLMSNALRFTPDGGTIRIEARATKDAVYLQVSDSGPGLTTQEAADCFEPFIQPVESPTPAPGTGLGLYISRSLAEAHRGTLECVGPAKGTGARFRLTLPMHRHTGPQVAEAVAASGAGAGRGDRLSGRQAAVERQKPGDPVSASA